MTAPQHAQHVPQPVDGHDSRAVFGILLVALPGTAPVG
jgi:hypothetical protein